MSAARDRILDEHREDLYNGGAPFDEDPNALEWWKNKAESILEDALAVVRELDDLKYRMPNGSR